MTDDEVLREAAFDGFELEERPCHDAWVWGWCRGDDRRVAAACSPDGNATAGWFREPTDRCSVALQIGCSSAVPGSFAVGELTPIPVEWRRP